MVRRRISEHRYLVRSGGSYWKQKKNMSQFIAAKTKNKWNIGWPWTEHEQCIVLRLKRSSSFKGRFHNRVLQIGFTVAQLTVSRTAHCASKRLEPTEFELWWLIQNGFLLLATPQLWLCCMTAVLTRVLINVPICKALLIEWARNNILTKQNTWIACLLERHIS